MDERVTGRADREAASPGSGGDRCSADEGNDQKCLHFRKPKGSINQVRKQQGCGKCETMGSLDDITNSDMMAVI